MSDCKREIHDDTDTYCLYKQYYGLISYSSLVIVTIRIKVLFYVRQLLSLLVGLGSCFVCLCGSEGAML